MYDIIIGRNKSDMDKFGDRGTVLIGKHYIKMGRETSLSNKVFLDVARAHVVFVCGKRGGGKCLHGDTLITLDDGSLVPIRDIKESNRHVMALNKNLKMQPSEKLDFYRRPVGRLLNIKLRSGKEIRLTPEHPLLTVKGWMPADRLNIGSRIATPRSVPAFGDEHISEAETKILAYLLAAGNVSNNFLSFASRDEKIVGDFRNSVRLFDENLKIHKHPPGACFRVAEKRKRIVIKQPPRDRLGRFSSATAISGTSSLDVWLDKIGICKKPARQKHIPDIIFKLPRNKISLFLNRLFSCGASICREGGLFWKISYCSSSEKMAREVCHLLLRFGVVGRLRRGETADPPRYEIEIEGEFVHTFLSEIGLFGDKEEKAGGALADALKIVRTPNPDNIPGGIWDLYRPDGRAGVGRKLHYSTPKTYSESGHCSPSRQELLQIARADENDLLARFAASDIFWDEVVHVELTEGDFTVYDITVPENHNFVANDIIVHNSYTMGVIAEGLADLPKDVSDNLSFIMLDTMGIYWTMKYANKKEEDLLKDWGLKPKGLDVKIYTPAGYFKRYKEEGIPTDFPFSIRPSELDSSDWCITFGVSANEPMGVLIERTVNELKKKKTGFSVEEIIEAVQADSDAEKEVRDAVVNRFRNTEAWGVFSKEGTPLKELVQKGQVTVLDVSCYATVPNGWDVKCMVVGIISKKLFIERMVARKDEEYRSIHAATNYFGDDSASKQEMPLVWLVLDEAHEFLPNKGKTTATDPLVTILREGRQPGLSLILATQQPGKIHTDVMTQSDTVISHRITAKIDTDALGMLMQSYMREGLDRQLDNLPRVKGAAIVFDDTNEKMYPIRIRPRFTWHGGESPVAVKEKSGRFML
ncbi:MAG: LAGLIDADG family homing endonuclease [archaeon]